VWLLPLLIEVELEGARLDAVDEETDIVGLPDRAVPSAAGDVEQ